MKLSIIIPIYNESKIIENTIDTLKNYIDTIEDFATEIIFVSDGSTDGCEKKAKESIGNDKRFIITGYSDNRGKGSAVRFGILKATGDFRVYTDCDLAYGYEIIGTIVRLCRDNNYDIVIGSRNLDPHGHDGYTFIRRFVSKIYIKLISVTAGFKNSDSQSSIKCFSARAAEDIFSNCEINRFAFDLEALIIAGKIGYKINEYPVRIINHNEKESKVHLIKDTFQMLGDIRKIKRRTKNIKKKI